MLRSTPTRALAVALCALALLAAGCGSGSSAPKNLNATVKVVNAQPVGGIQDLKVKKGGTIHLTVASDTADEIHIHGYNVHKDVPANGSVSFDFPATIDGQFVIELENHKQQIASLQVEP